MLGGLTNYDFATKTTKNLQILDGKLYQFQAKLL